MDRQDVKTAINKLLENTPEDVLNEVLEYLKAIKGKSSDQIGLSRNLSKILKEDKELLERLAK